MSKRNPANPNLRRDGQIGKAIRRMEDLYARSIQANDMKTALAAQKELNRLLSLYPEGRIPPTVMDVDGTGDTATNGNTLALIGGYLRPLKLAEDSYPIEEHARLAAELIRQHGLSNTV